MCYTDTVYTYQVKSVHRRNVQEKTKERLLNVTNHNAYINVQHMKKTISYILWYQPHCRTSLV